MTESRAGGAAPQEPDFQKAREALHELGTRVPHHANQKKCQDCAYQTTVEIALESAEREIKRLRDLVNPPQPAVQFQPIPGFAFPPPDLLRQIEAIERGSVSPSVPKEDK